MESPMEIAVRELRESHGGTWGEHPEHAFSSWQHEVANNETRLGYWEWCVCQEEQAQDFDQGASSLLEITFRMGALGEPMANMDEVVEAMDYSLTHDAIEGTEIIASNVETARITVAVRLHHEVDEKGAQQIGEELDYQFSCPETRAPYEAELLDVVFPFSA